jgi:uncharacterized damage-inducible protein DinB
MTVSIDSAVFDPTEILLRYLQRARQDLVATLDGLSDYDVRRPMTPSGTSLLGLVKHVASVEIGYLGDCIGRPLDIDLPWDNEEAYDKGLDMYALAGESREFLLDLYRRSWAHGDANVRELGLDAPAVVPWWSEERKHTTLGWLVVHQLDETSHHAGHADIVRESIDGKGGDDHDQYGDEEHWSAFLGRIQAEADHFKA